MDIEQTEAGDFSCDLDHNVLQLVWTDIPLSDDDVKRTLERFGEHAAKRHGANLLVDVRKFHYAWGPQMDEWRDANVVPVYNDAGVRKFAFLLPEGARTRPPTRIGPAQFETGYFTSREAAEDWFSE